jgi:hypothetical protein
MTARKGPYSVCFLTSSWTRPVACVWEESEERTRDEPTSVSALTRPLTRTQVSEAWSTAKPGGQDEAACACPVSARLESMRAGTHRFIASWSLAVPARPWQGKAIVVPNSDSARTAPASIGFGNVPPVHLHVELFGLGAVIPDRADAIAIGEFAAEPAAEQEENGLNA